MTEELALLTEETERTIRARLVEVSSAAVGRPLCKVDPERWVDIARHICAGVSDKKIHENLGTQRATIARVRREMFGSVVEYRRAVAESIEINISLLDGVKREKFETMAQTGKLDELEIRCLKDLSVIQQLDSQRAQRLMGEADIKVEHKFEKVDFEERKKELLERRMRQAEAIDLED